MSKMKVSFILSLVILLAAVALFSGIVQVPFSSAAENNLPSMHHQSADILTADGGDPQPKPSPFPWLVAAA
jgi:hypothetical protein